MACWEERGLAVSYLDVQFHQPAPGLCTMQHASRQWTSPGHATPPPGHTPQGTRYEHSSRSSPGSRSHIPSSPLPSEATPPVRQSIPERQPAATTWSRPQDIERRACARRVKRKRWAPNPASTNARQFCVPSSVLGTLACLLAGLGLLGRPYLLPRSVWCFVIHRHCVFSKVNERNTRRPPLSACRNGMLLLLSDDSGNGERASSARM